MPVCRASRCGAAYPLPFARARHLADLPHDHVALDAAEPADEQQAVEVIDLVLKRARHQARAFLLLQGAVTIESLDDDPRRPHDRRVEPRQAEAAFLLELNTVQLHD